MKTSPGRRQNQVTPLPPMLRGLDMGFNDLPGLKRPPDPQLTIGTEQMFLAIGHPESGKLSQAQA